METKFHDVEIKQVRGYWEVRVDGKFFCTADTQLEAIRELEHVYDI